MASSNPWGKQPSKHNGTPSGVPGAQPEKLSTVSSTTQYQEIQEDELIALASIYGDDFVKAETTQGAWKKAEPAFSIHVRSSDDDISAILNVVFTATYPKSPPLLTLRFEKDISEGTRFKLQKIIENKPKELVGEEQAMIMEIVNACYDVLEDAAQAKSTGSELPSLEEERAAHEIAAVKLAEQQKEEETKKKQMDNLEEERMLGSLVQDEIKRQKAKAKETKRKSRPPGTIVPQASIENGSFKPADELIAFDQPIAFVDAAGDTLHFQVVANKFCIRRGPVSSCSTVRPVVHGVDVPTLALKETDLRPNTNEQSTFKKQLQILETELKALKEIRHQGILTILDFKIQKIIEADSSIDSIWTVSVLTEFAEKGSLEEFLDIAGSLSTAKVRSWTIELLDALRFMHENGIIHENIHTGNVLLVREPDGDVKLKLADAGYQRKLHSLSDKKPKKDSMSVGKSAYWAAPEISNSNQPTYTQKIDMWDFGIVFLQMAFGPSVIKKYASPSNLANSLSLSDSFAEFIGKLFKTDPRKRPRAFELSSSEFLATDAELLHVEVSSPSLSRFGSVSSLPLHTPRRRHDSMNAYSGPASRYKEDFVEEGRLGKGGFGEVVKARKKLDGQIYAIKKITQKSSASLTEVLKEVRLLSQLSHPSVVRYYNTWTEEIFDASERDDDTSTEAATNDFSASVISPGGDFNIEFANSTGAPDGGLDFISSRGYPPIEFGYDDNSDSESEDDDQSTSSSNQNAISSSEDVHRLALRRSRSDSRYRRSFRTVLYISMEYCDKRTLRDIIKRGLHKEDDEMWRLLRQILEGLVHIHGLNVVHRDLKPENVFIDRTSVKRRVTTRRETPGSDGKRDNTAIEENIREKVSDTLNRLNIGAWSWQKIKNELRSPMVGVSATSVDDLQNFDFRGI
ncbi:putative Serine/threonine-protein kinase gcn2 [Glarea lozoyensis 74030]|uniref:non-specific serine/threonine protein kinase n=1 Tax=Glarea lozoyensis (strain ATCC 74030 / MF5533) TaxID=1104152 RepID=H0EHH4_GLAL7|nr:putative Serine/threonine-protein kinase gcn2 [Glarea lozoyensis 74030]